MATDLLVIVQVRMESKRFPGKALADLLGQPLLLWVLHALSRLTLPHRLVVACPDTPLNSPLADLCAKHGYEAYLSPGDPNDVLGRFHAVATQYQPYAILRACGDTPLLCADIVEDLLDYHWAHGQSTRGAILKGQTNEGALHWDVGSIVGRYPDHTGLGVTWGDGLDCGVFLRSALERAHGMTHILNEREHLEPAFYRHPQQFRCAVYEAPFDLSWLRLSVDTPGDLALVSTILTALLDRYGFAYGWREVWQTVERFPELKTQMRARVHNAAYVAQVAQETGMRADWENLRYGTGARRCHCGARGFTCGHNPRAYVFPGTNLSLRYDGSWGQPGDAH